MRILGYFLLVWAALCLWASIAYTWKFRDFDAYLAAHEPWLTEKGKVESRFVWKWAAILCLAGAAVLGITGYFLIR